MCKLFLLLIGAFGLCHCALSYPDPSTLSDHRNSASSEDFTTFKVGDWFELIKPMFLINSTSSGKLITVPGQGAPLVEEFVAADGRIPHPPYDILKFLPEGTRIKVVSIKKPGNFGPTPYFYLDAEYPWVDALFRENWSLDTKYGRDQVKKWYGNRKFGENVRFVVDYDRDYFRKVE